MLTCVTCTCCVTSLGLGDVNVHVNLRHMHMLRHVTHWVGGMLTFMLTCVTCACYVTSLGWGDANVHVNLRHMHMLRHVTGLGVMFTFMLTCFTCTCRVTSLGWASKNGGKLSVIKRIVKRGSKAEPLCTHCGWRGHICIIMLPRDRSCCHSCGKNITRLLEDETPKPKAFWRSLVAP